LNWRSKTNRWMTAPISLSLVCLRPQLERELEAALEQFATTR
jgi:hypothetical protein